MRERILICLFFVAVFINFLGPIVDPDFPFHLKTGEYIYQHREIPKDDPFSFYGKGIVTDRERFTLSQYWISQIIFYKIYSLIGPPGVITLRAIVFSGFVFILWFVLRKRGIYSSLIIAILVSVILQACKVDRPQNFSFLFTLALILLFEKYRARPDSALPLYFIPPIMLLWANMHAGFVFGVAVILIYSLAEALKLFVNKQVFIGKPLGKDTALKFFVTALLAILVSYINPIRSGQIIAVLGSHTDVNWLYKISREYVDPIKEISFPLGNRTAVLAFFLIFGFISIVVFLNSVRTRSMDITNFGLIVFSSIAAFTAVRYIPFFIAIALPLSKNYKFFVNEEPLRKLRKSAVSLALFFVFIIGAIGYGLKDRNNMLKLGHPANYQEGVVQFLLDNHIDANMFNQFNKGSYLIWRLYPYYKVFNDTRFISLEAVIESGIISNSLEDYKQSPGLSLVNSLSALVPKELGSIGALSESSNSSSKINNPLWSRLLEQYSIDLIVHEACTEVTKEIYPLTLRLLNDDDWILIYLDGTMQIFIRNEEKYSNIIEKFKLPKEFIYDEIILETIPFVKMKMPISTPYSSLAFALMMKGKESDARKMIDAALAIDDNDLVANFCNAYLALVQRARENSAHKIDRK